MSDNDPNANRPGYKETKVGWIPENWDCQILKNLVNSDRPICYGVVQTGDHIQDGVPCVRVADLVEGTLDPSRMIRTTEEIHQQYKRTILHKGDLMVALRGDVGRSEVAPSHLEGANLTRGVALLSKSAKFDSTFLREALRSPKVSRIIRVNINGTALKEIPIESLKRIPVPIPPISEQTRVSSFLTTCDEAIEKTDDLIKAKERQKRALMQQLLAGKKRLPGFAQPGGMIETRTGQIPSDWRWIHLGEAFRKRVERSGDTLPLMAITIDSGMVRRDSIDRKVDSELTASDNLVARKGDISYNTMRMWQGAVGVAEEDCHVSPAYVVCTPEVGVSDSSFYYYWFKSAEGLHLLWSYSYGITGDRLRLYADDFFLVPAPLPSLREQQAIVAVIRSAEQEIAQLQQKRTAFQQQKKALMQKLLTGQVRVKV